jgi:alpha-methylacyl-CoA racemase
MAHTTGPLTGLRVIELASLGPGPHAAMTLADLGAEVVRIDRPTPTFSAAADAPDFMLRGRRSLMANMKDQADLDLVLSLIERADVLIEGYRPGVAERLGVGPNECLARNPRLIYGRMTGWGQEGPRASTAGHDINYISITGALHAIGRTNERPVLPLNLIGDFGGGSMLLVIGVLSALVERARTDVGQVVDAAMVDGASLLMQMVWSLFGVDAWRDAAGTNLLDGGAPFYDTYACADGKFVAVGALEEPFYAALLQGLELDMASVPDRNSPAQWPALRKLLADTFARRTRDEWAKLFENSDACVTPVLSLAEAPRDPHLAARGTLVELHGITQAAPAPRFSKHPQRTLPTAPPMTDAHRAAIVAEWLGH